MMTRLDLTDTDSGAAVKIRAKTRAARDEILEVRGDALLVAVTDPPERGKANKAIVKILAKQLGLAKSNLTIISGQTHRDKRIAIAGLSARDVRDRLNLSTPTT